MSTTVHLAGEEDRDRLLALAARAREERGRAAEPDRLARAYAPLLGETGLGAAWLVGPRSAPLGYVTMGFGWSVELGGAEGWLTDIWIRPRVRRRGIGTEALHAIAVSLGREGVRALHVRLPRGDAGLAAFCARVGFAARSDDLVMTDPL